MFIAQLPQMPSLQLRRKVRVGSISFLIRIKASSIIGPVLLRSNVYDCILGFSVGMSGFHLYTWKVLIRGRFDGDGSLTVEVCDSGTKLEVGSLTLEIGSTVA